MGKCKSAAALGSGVFIFNPPCLFLQGEINFEVQLLKL
jgi:hypothetical protein